MKTDTIAKFSMIHFFSQKITSFRVYFINISDNILR